MEKLIVELNFETQDSRKVPGKESMVPDKSEIKLESKTFNLSSMRIGASASLLEELLIFLRK
jgi:hypothetical protein